MKSRLPPVVLSTLVWAVGCGSTLDLREPVAEPSGSYAQHVLAGDPVGFFRWGGRSHPEGAEAPSPSAFDGARAAELDVDIDGFELTVDLWTRSPKGTLLSVSTARSADLLGVSVADTVQLTFMGELHDTGLAITDSDWHQLAVRWSSVDGSLSLGMDGRWVWSGDAPTDVVFPASGRWIVGQRQGCAGGCS